MTIEAKVIADSYGEHAPRLTTIQLQYPRFIHSEFMTHRVFSRNASSSRAIPVEKQIKNILKYTAMPIHWGKNQRGMQADEEISEPVEWRLDATMEFSGYGEIVGGTPEEAWLAARDAAILAAKAYHDAGYHKQVVNRILEPYSHISVVVTATQFKNFFNLRRHKDAQPEIKALADAMYEAMEDSSPVELDYGDWHLPYISDEELSSIDNPEVPYDLDDMIKASVARCARVSYLTHDGKNPDLDADIALHHRLVGSVPLHASPAEHQATPWMAPLGKSRTKNFLGGNLGEGWVQYRKLLPGEFEKN